MKALIISADNFEDSELIDQNLSLIEEWVQVDIGSIKKDNIKRMFFIHFYGSVYKDDIWNDFIFHE